MYMRVHELESATFEYEIEDDEHYIGSSAACGK